MAERGLWSSGLANVGVRSGMVRNVRRFLRRTVMLTGGTTALLANIWPATVGVGVSVSDAASV